MNIVKAAIKLAGKNVLMIVLLEGGIIVFSFWHVYEVQFKGKL